MDYLEIMDFCGYDVDAADRMAKKMIASDLIKEVLEEVGLDKLEPKSDGEKSWRLCSKSCERCAWC